MSEFNCISLHPLYKYTSTMFQAYIYSTSTHPHCIKFASVLQVHSHTVPSLHPVLQVHSHNVSRLYLFYKYTLTLYEFCICSTSTLPHCTLTLSHCGNVIVECVQVYIHSTITFSQSNTLVYCKVPALFASARSKSINLFLKACNNNLFKLMNSCHYKLH